VASSTLFLPQLQAVLVGAGKKRLSLLLSNSSLCNGPVVGPKIMM
jgi:hypothetical protein